MPTPLNINNAPQLNVNNVPPIRDTQSPQYGEKRSSFSPDPCMGLPPRWNVGDLPQSYSTPVLLVNQFTGNSSSAALNPQATYDSGGNIMSGAFNPQANSVELYATFSDNVTSCTVTVYNDDGTGNFVQVAQYNNVTLVNCSNLYAGEYVQNISLGGRAIKVGVTNYVGTATISISCNRLN